jgi:hypothetical protein
MDDAAFARLNRHAQDAIATETGLALAGIERVPGPRGRRLRRRTWKP